VSLQFLGILEQLGQPPVVVLGGGLLRFQRQFLDSSLVFSNRLVQSFEPLIKMQLL